MKNDENMGKCDIINQVDNNHNKIECFDVITIELMQNEDKE